MQPEKDLEYYKAHPKELVGKEILYNGEPWWWTVVSITAGNAKFIANTGCDYKGNPAFRTALISQITEVKTQ